MIYYRNINVSRLHCIVDELSLAKKKGYTAFQQRKRMRLPGRCSGLGFFVCMHVCACMSLCVCVCVCVFYLFIFLASIPANLCTASRENHIHGNQLHHSYPHQWRLQSKLSNILCTSCKIGLFSLYLRASSFRGYMFMQMRIVLFLSGWLNTEFVLHLGNAKPCCLATWYTT